MIMHHRPVRAGVVAVLGLGMTAAMGSLGSVAAAAGINAAKPRDKRISGPPARSARGCINRRNPAGNTAAPGNYGRTRHRVTTVGNRVLPVRDETSRPCCQPGRFARSSGCSATQS